MEVQSWDLTDEYKVIRESSDYDIYYRGVITKDNIE